MKVSKEKALKSCHNFWQIHNTAKGYPENYPDEEVVRFLMRIKSLAKSKGKKTKNLKILDLGTGSGKNIQPVLDIGFQLYVTDWSSGGLEYIKKRIRKKNIINLFYILIKQIYPIKIIFLTVNCDTSF